MQHPIYFYFMMRRQSRPLNRIRRLNGLNSTFATFRCYNTGCKRNRLQQSGKLRASCETSHTLASGKGIQQPLAQTESSMEQPFKPTKQQLQEARDKTVPDVIAPGLRVLFCGINPGLYTAAVGHHFARPGNRFWPALHQSGFTSHQLSPFEERRLLERGYGIVNIVSRATARADELSPEELAEGGVKLDEKVRIYHPCFVAVLGISAYRMAFRHPQAVLGFQQENLGKSACWVLPNPSGLNAHYLMKDLVRLFAALKTAVDRSCSWAGAAISQETVSS